MHWSLRYFAFCLAACTGNGRDPVNEVAMRVVDRAGHSMSRAVVWTLPSKSWERRSWIPSEFSPYFGNPHELIRRLGSRRVADDSGSVRVPRGAVVAGESAGLAGVTTVGDKGDAPNDLVLDDWHWTIVVRNQEGKPVAGVPVSCAIEEDSPNDEFEGESLGLTDAEGRLVVRAPGSIDLCKYPSQAGGPVRTPPEFVLFEVDGMYLDAHAQRLSLKNRESGSVTLTLPPVTKVEVRVPEWKGAVAANVTLTRISKGMVWDTAMCWSESDKHYGLVGLSDGTLSTPIVARIDGTPITTGTEVPRLPGNETFLIQLHLDKDDVIVRARVRDASGQPASLAVLCVTSTSSKVLGYVHADREGRVALVLRPDAIHGTTLALQVDSTPNPELMGARAEFQVDGLHPGDHRDVGIITLTRQ